MYTIFIGWDWRVYFARVRHDSIIDADNLVTSEVPYVLILQRNETELPGEKPSKHRRDHLRKFCHIKCLAHQT